MSEIPKKYCVFGCDHLVLLGVPMHRFPHPEKKPDLFNAWLSVLGDKLKETDRMKIYRSKRLCDHHFDPEHKVSGDRLKVSTIPSVNLHSIKSNYTTFVQADHCYTRPLRESSRSVPMMDITNLPGPSRLTVDAEIPMPSGSGETTCPTIPDKTQYRAPRTKFDAEKTFQFLQEKTTSDCTRKMRHKENEIRRLRQRVKAYKHRLRQMRKASIKKDFDKLTQNMSASARLFTRMQFMEGQKKKKGHRFTQNEKILSLSLYKRSPKAYNLMCKHFTLPSRKVLKSLLAQVKMQPGINPVIFDQLKQTVLKMLPRDRLCTLIFDEMSISPQIFYNAHTDDLVGFENYGTEKTKYFANHALVFMVKGIKKNFKQPVAYFFTQRLSTPKLKEILKEVVTSVQQTGLKIVATVCDQGSPNSSCINQLISEAKAEYFKLGKQWRNDLIIINDEEIIPLYDVPHLIKGIRSARNVAPNCMGFEGAFKTLLLNNISSDHSVNSNCEKDTNKCLQSLSFFLKNKDQSNAPSQSQDIVIDQPLDVMMGSEEDRGIIDDGADQRTYVCGWALTKCLQKVVRGCEKCKSKLLGNSTNEKYRYIRAREFEKNKQWLCYPSDYLVACFHEIQKTTIAFLNSECYKKNIKERIIAFADMFIDFSFMDCIIHKDKLKDCFLNSVINIIIYSWCRTVNRILEGKLNYEGSDVVKKAAQMYYNTHKSIKK